ncbi:MAG: RumA [Devosia sp.]|nr:RumA [Devosia sp.]
MRAEISALGLRGEGVADLEGGLRVFVPFTLPGETVEITIAGDRGMLDELLAASPERIEPFCPHFGICGGCALQHLSGPAYAEFKRGLVETQLRRAGIDVEIGALIDAKGDGRRRATLHARKGGAGYMRPRTHTLRDIDRCPILVPALVARAPELARRIFLVVGDCDIAFTATATGIDADIRAPKRTNPEPLVAMAQVLKLARLTLNGDTVLQQAPPAIRIGRVLVEVPPSSFLQATEAADTVLSQLVLDAVGPGTSVVDLFCGMGPFALRLAETRRVTAIDSDKPALAALQKALRTVQGLKPVTALFRDLFREALGPEELKGFDAVVFDPPRAGAENQARSIAASKVRTVVAVSCDPATFARDAAILIGGGYRLDSVTPVDQFAYSPHVEIVAKFTRA